MKNKFLFVEGCGVPTYRDYGDYDEFVKWFKTLNILNRASVELDQTINDEKIILCLEFGVTSCDAAHKRLRLGFTTNVFRDQLETDDDNKPTPKVIETLTKIQSYLDTIFKDKEVDITGDFDPKKNTAELWFNINNVSDDEGEPVEGFDDIISERVARTLYNGNIVYILQ